MHKLLHLSRVLHALVFLESISCAALGVLSEVVRGKLVPLAQKLTVLFDPRENVSVCVLLARIPVAIQKRGAYKCILRTSDSTLPVDSPVLATVDMLIDFVAFFLLCLCDVCFVRRKNRIAVGMVRWRSKAPAKWLVDRIVMRMVVAIRI